MLEKYSGICVHCFLFRALSPLHKMTECPMTLNATAALQDHLEWGHQLRRGTHHPVNLRFMPLPRALTPPVPLLSLMEAPANTLC